MASRNYNKRSECCKLKMEIGIGRIALSPPKISTHFGFPLIFSFPSGSQGRGLAGLGDSLAAIISP